MISERYVPASLMAIVESVARARKLPIREVLSRTKQSRLVRARWEVWATANRTNPKLYSVTRLGALFGYDHSSVRHGLNQHREGRKPWSKMS